MMVLCPNHHDMMKATPIERQRLIKATPCNLKNGYVYGLLKINHPFCALRIGNVEFVGEGVGFYVDGESILSVGVTKEGLVGLSARVYRRDGTLIAEIVDNEWISGEPLAWDIEAKWQSLIIREKSHHINISLQTQQFPMLIQGAVYYKGMEIEWRPDGLSVSSKQAKMGGARFQHLALANGAIKFSTQPPRIILGPVIGEKMGLVSEPDQEKRVQKAYDSFRQLKGDHILKVR